MNVAGFTYLFETPGQGSSCFYLVFISNLIFTKVVTSNTAHDKVYSIKHYAINFVSDL